MSKKTTILSLGNSIPKFTATIAWLICITVVALSAKAATISGEETTKQTIGEGDSLTVTESGSIIPTSDVAVVATNSVEYIVNYGAINTGEFYNAIEINVDLALNPDMDALTGYIAGSNDSIANYGILEGKNVILFRKAIVAGDISNYAGATITAHKYGFNIANATTINGRLYNAGTIEAMSDGGVGIYLSYGPVGNSVIEGGIRNEGAITAKKYAIHLLGGRIGTAETAANIENAGAITSNDKGINLNDDAVVHGDIINAGSITRADVESSVINEGIKLGQESEVTGSIVNSGTISGFDEGVGLYGSSKAKSITNTGEITGNNGAILVYTGSEVETITNTGTAIGIDTAGDGTNTAAIRIDELSRVTTGITNSGVAQGVVGVLVDRESSVASLENTGEIIGSDTGVRVDNSDTGGTYDPSYLGVLHNAGSVQGSETAVHVDHESTIGLLKNSGNVVADTVAIHVDNQSTVTTLENDSTGVITGGSGVLVTNESTVGNVDNAGAIEANAEDGVVFELNTGANITDGFSNSGIITAHGDNGIALRLNDSTLNGGISNSGTISGSDAIILDNASEVDSFTNSGTVNATGEEGVGLGVYNASKITHGISNNGMIKGHTGIFIENGYGGDSGDTPTVVNTGTVIGTGGTAIDFDNNDHSSLTLNDGSVIVGTINFGSGSGNHFTINNTADAVYRYSGSLDTLSVSEDVLYTHNNNAVAVVNKTGFELVGDHALKTSIDIGNVLSTHLTSVRTSSRKNVQVAQNHDVMSDTEYQGWLGAFEQEKPYFWIEGFASYKKNPPHNEAEATSTRTNGMIVGIEKPFDDTRVGVFAGQLDGYLSVGNNAVSQQIEADGVFAGGYISFDRNPYFVNISLTSGLYDNVSSRYVNTIMGYETAESDYTDAFFTPSVTVGREIKSLDAPFPVVASLTLRYTGQWIEKYTERGLTEGNVTVDERFLSTASGRVELESAHRGFDVGYGVFKINGRVGIEANQRLGSHNTNIYVLDTHVVASPQYQSHTTDVFMGLDLSYNVTNSVDFYTNLEVSRRIGESLEHSKGGFIKAGIKIEF